MRLEAIWFTESVKVFPRTRYPFYLRLSTKFSFCSYFERHTGYLLTKTS